MKFTVYSKANCPQCEMAKALISNQQLRYKEVLLDVGYNKEEGKEYITRDELLSLVPTAKSMPQIFLDEKYVGGYSELRTLIAIK
jgi:glutaredoxin 3